jgi:hypothetical protein
MRQGLITKSMWFKVAISLASTLVAGQGFAADESETVEVEVENLFVPSGFDDNDESVIVLDGMLRSGCYKISQAKFTVDQETNTIQVTQYARKYPGPCVMALVPFTNEVRLGVLPQGDYTVVTNSGALSERLEVKEALNAGPDDYLYAPVEAVTVHEISTDSNGNYIAFLTGRFTTNCMAWDSTKVVTAGKTVALQPIIKMLDLPVCEDATIPFRIAVDLPRNLADGRNLLHTRSLSGRSVNTVFTVK